MSKLSRGGIAGIVVGCVLVLLAILLCFYELHLRKKARLAAPEAGLSVPGASDTSYEGGSYGRLNQRGSHAGLYGGSYELGLGYASPSLSSYGRPTYLQDDSTFAQKVREVRPDPVGGEVWMPRLFEKVRVRLKTIQDDLELV
jgi:hypothetical protein